MNTPRPRPILTLSAPAGKQFAPYLKRRLLQALPLIPTQLTDLNLALVNNAKMAQLHLQFLNIKGPTDVLTFPLDLDHKKRPTSAQIVICVPVAQKQARLHHHPVSLELLLYAIHGILHLSGFDDNTMPAFNRMHAAEDQLLQKLGLPRAFTTGQIA